MRGAMEEIEQLTRERDDAWEARDAWHARVAHIAQALGMQPPPSGDWRDVVFAEVEQAVAAQRRELEAARAVVEKSREVVRQQLGEDLSWWWNREMRQAPSSSVTVAALAAADALNAYDAAKAGKAVE